MKQESLALGGDASPGGPPEVVAIPDASIELYQGFLPAQVADAFLDTLISTLAWRQEHIRLFGRSYLQPRLLAWYGDSGSDYRYSGVRHTPLPWTAELAELRDAIEGATGARFNSVLANRYRDGQDAMGLHSDDEPELGPEPVIASLSLGAKRVFYLRHRQRRELGSVDLPLPHGSLLIMAGKTQQYWKHGLRRTRRPCGERINLTFRKILPAAP